MSSSSFVSLLVSILLFYFVTFTNGKEYKIGIRNEYRSTIHVALNKRYGIDLGSTGYYPVKSGKNDFWKRFRAWKEYVFTIKVNGRKEKQPVSLTYDKNCYCVCSDASIKRGRCINNRWSKSTGIDCEVCRPKKKIKRTLVRRLKLESVCGNSMHKYLGKADYPGACYDKCKKYDSSCSFFYWSDKRQRKNKCYWVGDCKTPKRHPYFDVYTYGPPYVNVKRRYRHAICRGRHTKLGKFRTFGECKNRCAKQNGCKYFIYGNRGWRKGVCQWERIRTTKCKAIRYDGYDIYEIWRKDNTFKPSDFEDIQTDIVDDNDDDNADDVDIDIDVDIDPDNDDYKGAVVDMNENINELFDDIDKDENDYEVFVDNKKYYYYYYRDIFIFGSVILVILLFMYYLINKCKIINKVGNESTVVMDEITPMIAKQ